MVNLLHLALTRESSTCGALANFGFHYANENRERCVPASPLAWADSFPVNVNLAVRSTSAGRFLNVRVALKIDHDYGWLLSQGHSVRRG